VRRRAVVVLFGGAARGSRSPLHVARNPEPSARDMMEKNFFVSKIKSLKTASTMLLVNDKGQTRERKASRSPSAANGIDRSSW